MNIRRIVKTIFKKAYYCRIKIELKRNKRCDLIKNDELLESLCEKKKIVCYMPKSRNKNRSDIDLSIIIPLYNSEKFIDKLIICLVKQNTRYKYEIILIDDGSTDNTVKNVSEHLNDYKDKIVLKRRRMVEFLAREMRDSSWREGSILAF